MCRFIRTLLTIKYDIKSKYETLNSVKDPIVCNMAPCRRTNSHLHIGKDFCLHLRSVCALYSLQTIPWRSSSSKESVTIYQSTLRHVPEKLNLLQRRCLKLKSRTLHICWFRYYFLHPCWCLSLVKLLKPTGHVMHQQFNIQQLYVLPTLYLRVLYLSENKQRLVPLTA